jgi:ABC-type transport system substrate-binding protein
VALTPKAGGTLRIAANSIGANVGWPAAFTAGGDLVQSYYETLLHSDEKGNLYPWLAESFKVADDQKSITFTIRKGVKFSDGSDLTADVVKWNLEQYAKSQRWTSVEVVDPNTVRVNYKTWESTIPASFGDGEPALYMVSKTAYDTNGQDWITTHPVGTGAFTVASYATDSTMKLVKNPNYWATDAQGNKLPYLDGLDYTFITDASTTLMMAKTGELDMVLDTFPNKQLLTEYKKLGWRINSTADANEVWVPDSAHADSPWSKLEVREAAEYAVDRATIAQKFGYGYLQAPNQIPPRSTTAYDANYAFARNYDPAKAKELLTQAGYPNGFKTTLIIWPGGNRDIALAEQQYLLAVGIQVEVQFADMGKLNSYLGPQGTYHNALLEMTCPAQGPTGLGAVNFAMSMFGNNFLQPPELTQALGAATSAPVPDVSLVRAITDVLTKNALLIPVYELGGARVEQPYVVADFGHRGIPAFSSLQTAWLNK